MPSAGGPKVTYTQAVRSPSYNYLLAIVLLLLYEGSVWMMQAVGRGQVVNGVDAWSDWLLMQIPYGTWILSGAIVIGGLAILIQDRKQGVPIRGSLMLLMLVEATVWALALLLILPPLIGRLLQGSIAVPAQMAAAQPTWIENMGLSLGAGFYEEFFFRLVLVWMLRLVLRLFGVNTQGWGVKLGIVVVSAAIFSAVHYIGPMGDAFNLYSFLYRMVMGLIFSVMLVWRRFAITAWSHAIYDMFVFTAQAFG